MKLTIPARVLRIFTGSSVLFAAPFAIATLSPVTTLEAKEPLVNIEATNATTGYQEAPGVFTITLSEKQDKPVKVFYTILESRAENGVDYNRLSGMKVIKAHKTHATIQIVPTASSDGPYGSGPVDLKLKKGAGYKLGPNKEASVEIDIVLP